jgi:hypothetical protein
MMRLPFEFAPIRDFAGTVVDLIGVCVIQSQDHALSVAVRGRMPVAGAVARQAVLLDLSGQPGNFKDQIMPNQDSGAPWKPNSKFS